MPPRQGKVSPRGPGPVAAMHRLFIATALAGAFVYGLWELREFGRGAGGGAMLRAAAAFLVCIGIGIYFRSLRGLRAKLTPRDD